MEQEGSWQHRLLKEMAALLEEARLTKKNNVESEQKYGAPSSSNISTLHLHSSRPSSVVRKTESEQSFEIVSDREETDQLEAAVNFEKETLFKEPAAKSPPEKLQRQQTETDLKANKTKHIKAMAKWLKASENIQQRMIQCSFGNVAAELFDLFDDMLDINVTYENSLPIAQMEVFGKSYEGRKGSSVHEAMGLMALEVFKGVFGVVVPNVFEVPDQKSVEKASDQQNQQKVSQAAIEVSDNERAEKTSETKLTVENGSVNNEWLFEKDEKERLPNYVNDAYDSLEQKGYCDPRILVEKLFGDEVKFTKLTKNDTVSIKFYLAEFPRLQIRALASDEIDENAHIYCAAKLLKKIFGLKIKCFEDREIIKMRRYWGGDKKIKQLVHLIHEIYGRKIDYLSAGAILYFLGEEYVKLQDTMYLNSAKLKPANILIVVRKDETCLLTQHILLELFDIETNIMKSNEFFCRTSARKLVS